MRTRLVSVALVTLAVSVALFAQSARDLYQQGLVQEHAHGDLREAVALYTRAAQAAGTDRALAAKALIRVAGSREKLGQPAAAASAYAEVVRSYPEQRAEVALSQGRLAALRRTSPADSSATGAGPTDVSSLTGPLFGRYCTGCHDSTITSGGLDLGSLNARNVGEHTAVWETVTRRLQARRDPPNGHPRPDDTTYRAVVSGLGAALDAAHAARTTWRPADRVTDMELAERIAKLLWNDVPDAPLLDDARRGSLRSSVVLHRQVLRMLRDQRSTGLVDGFFAEWLSLGTLQAVRPDPGLFPQFDAALLQAMDTETRLFLGSQLRDDRDAVELWTADYSYVNERLARHYGLPNVTGAEFRRVTWPDATRGGILGQAGPLTALSPATRTSPTVRGLYVLTRFLGMDAPSPPANIPPLPEDPATRPGTLRDRMLAHKTNPSCASCHVVFDPLGLALEHFDALGRWRTTEGGTAIDASGTFIDGTSFAGPEGLRSGLLAYRDAYYASLTQRLLAHALNRNRTTGRVYDYEMPVVRRIVRDAAPNGYRWSSLLTGIVASAPFQMRDVVP